MTSYIRHNHRKCSARTSWNFRRTCYGL